MSLYTFLNESFDEADGGLIGYAINNITQTATANRHYNLRSFSSFNYTIARTMQDLAFWNVYQYTGQTMAALQNPVSLTGSQANANPISAVDGKIMSALDTTAMSALDFFYITAGSEQWTAISGSQFTLSKSAGNTSLLAVSGNEITDTVRAQKFNGDGRQNDSSYGIWQASTNLAAHGGYLPNSGNNNILTNDTTNYLFGSKGIRVQCNAGDGPYFQFATISPFTQYTTSVWVYCPPGSVGKSINLIAREYKDSSHTNGGITTLSGSGTLSLGWQRFSTTGTTISGSVFMEVDIYSASANNDYTINGLQVEQKPYATPYMFTDNGQAISTATRGASSVSAPPSVLTTTQGWMAIRTRVGWGSTAGVQTSFASLSDGSANNRIALVFNSGWATRRVVGGVSGATLTVSDSFNAGDYRTVLLKWDASTIGISVSGSVFQTVNNSQSSFTPTSLNIGGSPANGVSDSDVLWFACGTGTLTNANATTLNSFGNTDPTWSLLPGAPTLLWTANTGTYNTSTDYRYSDLLDVTVSGNAAVTSTYNDDILTNFNVPNQPYYIEFIARELKTPFTSPSGMSINLDKSFIDFSSDASGHFDPTKTDSFSFSQSLTSMMPGGDQTFRITRSSLVNSDLTNLKHVQFRLVSSGTGSGVHFKAQGLRMYPFQNYTFNVTDVDTKRQFYTRSLPVTGTAEPAISSGIYFFGGTTPKNVKQTVRFNSGHSPVGNSNIINLYYRYTANSQGNNPNYIKVNVAASVSGTVFAVSTAVSGVETTLASSTFAALQNETDYFLKVDLVDSTIRAAVYLVNSAFPGSVVYDQGNLTVPLTGRGQLGWEFNPYNYDFTLDYIRVSRAEFGEVRTKTSPSISPVKGILLQSVNSPPVDLLSGQTYIVAQDATLTQSTTFGSPTPPSSFIQRGTTDWWGGIFTSNFINIGNTGQLYIQGDIFPNANYTGNYRVVFLDSYGSVGYLHSLTGLLGGQWNNFYVPIRINIAPNAYQIGIVNDGFGGDSFYLDNLQLLHHTIEWKASNDNGATYQSFYDGINSETNGIVFAQANRNLKIDARTHADNAWIANFSYKPIYQYPGLLQANNISIGLRIKGI